MKTYKVLSMAALILVGIGARAEEVSISAPTPIQSTKEAKPKHNFNRYDFALYGGVVAYRALDFWSTERNLAIGAKEVELPQAFVASKPGFAAYEVGMGGLQIEGSMFLHRHGHAKLARLVDSVAISAGMATDARNIQQHGVQLTKNAARGIR